MILPRPKRHRRGHTINAAAAAAAAAVAAATASQQTASG
jgi:cobalamin biosynthesis protein CbiD